MAAGGERDLVTSSDPCPARPHGVRKIAATRAASAGATEAELMAIFGWTDPKMASHYTRTAPTGAGLRSRPSTS